MQKLRVKYPSQVGKAEFKVKGRGWGLTASSELQFLQVLGKGWVESGMWHGWN